jgi:nucleotide-binding universal stress UspA family protein
MNEKTFSRRKYREFAVPGLILLPTDLQDDIDSLVPHAVAQARDSGAMLALLHVVPPAERIELDATALLPADAAEAEQEARRKLGSIAAELRSKGIRSEVFVRHGQPADVVPDVAQEIGAGRVIMGTHGRHWTKSLLGSVASEILHKIEVPVCTIGPHVHCGWTEGPRRILHPVSFSDGYEHSARIALEIAQFHQAEITLLHVLPRDTHREYESEQVQEWTRTKLERLIPEEAPLWICSVVQAETGAVVGEILKTAEERKADLVVLGVSSDMSFWPFGGETTAYEIIRQAKCPVITVRRPATPKGAKKQDSKEADCVA